MPAPLFLLCYFALLACLFSHPQEATAIVVFGGIGKLLRAN